MGKSDGVERERERERGCVRPQPIMGGAGTHYSKSMGRMIGTGYSQLMISFNFIWSYSQCTKT